MNTVPITQTYPYAQLANWIFRPLDYMETNYRRYGDLFFARWGVLEWVFLNHPEAIKTVLSQDMGAAISAPGETNNILKPLLGEHSVILLSGHQHRQRRKLIMPPFHGERLKVYADLIRQITLEVMAELQRGQALQARQLIQKMTMRVILQAVFGLHEGDRCRRLESLLAERLDMVSKPLASTVVFFPVLRKNYGSWSPGAKIARLTAEIDELLYAEIRDRRASVDASHQDVLSLLIMAQDEAGQGLSDAELHDELMTLLVAGHETTATAIAWGLHWAHYQPNIRAKIRDEIAIAGANDDAMALTKLPYLEAVCHETLRIYPVAMLTFARVAQQPLELMGHAIDPGTLLVGCIYLLHHREDLYPQPSEFRPERFLERQYSAFEFMPFGGGARRCIGYALAMYELKIILGTLLTHYDFELVSDRPAIPERRGVTLGMKNGVEMIYQGPRSVPAPVAL
ncbi:cytochrome P450 [Halomicronema sp. CCY15110]|uniref:cytochrome P450 n=1 Tax=Halomicronema sp. CCY15110 TaxID=2767773 RepID=UPI0019523FF3|nr:cytochrome P450 [Halomicronema sp. CCY15110]